MTVLYFQKSLLFIYSIKKKCSLLSLSHKLFRNLYLKAVASWSFNWSVIVLLVDRKLSVREQGRGRRVSLPNSSWSQVLGIWSLQYLANNVTLDFFVPDPLDLSFSLLKKQNCLRFRIFFFFFFKETKNKFNYQIPS